MRRRLTIFSGTKGLNTEVDPVRLAYDWKTGIQFLSKAVNIDIDSTGRISRRKGYVKKISGSYHSIFSCGLYSLAVTGDALTVIDPGYATTAIRKVTPAARMSYALAGVKVYYMNGHEKGYVENRVSYPWEAADYVGPDTTKIVSDPPVGHLIAIHGSRMFVAVDNAVFYSNAYALSQYDLARNYVPFFSRVTLMASVADGFWVSDGTGVYYLAGLTPTDFRLVKKSDYPAVEGTAAIVNGHNMAGGDMPGISVVFATKEGVCIGGEGGKFINLTGRRISYPSAETGAGVVINDKYIAVLKP